MYLNNADAPAVVPPAVAAQPVVRRTRISDTDKERLIAAFNGNADYLELARNLESIGHMRTLLFDAVNNQHQ